MIYQNISQLNHIKGYKDKQNNIDDIVIIEHKLEYSNAVDDSY